MSNTTKKDEKAVAADVANLESAISGLSYSQLAELLKTKKDQEIESVTHKLKEARGIVSALEAQLLNLGVETGVTLKAGRKPVGLVRVGRKAAPKPANVTKKAKGKRGAVGEAILKYLSTKGKEGAHVKDIAAHVGNKPANVTAYFYAGAGKKHAKQVAPATFALKK